MTSFTGFDAYVPGNGFYKNSRSFSVSPIKHPFGG